MSDEKLEMDLDPKKVIAGLMEMSKASQKLNEDMEKALKGIEKNFQGLEDKSQETGNKISSQFRNLGNKLKEDLKNLIDVGKVFGGLSMANEVKKGADQILSMEQAVARLNTRLGLTKKEMTQFSNSVGRSAANAGIDPEKLWPGIEEMSAKGGVKSPQQLAEIADVLAKTSAVTHEDTGGLSDVIIQILKDQGKQVTSATVKDAADALASTRVNGAFSSSTEAGEAIKAMTANLKPDQLNQMGLGTRELGGLAAMASRGGERGNEIMQSIMQTASSPGGKEKINSILGASIFDKNGKMDVSAFKNVSQEAWGKYTSQGRAAALNVNQADLSRFITSMQGNQATYGAITKGSGEVNKQFDVGTNSTGDTINKFKGKAIEGVREIGDGFMQFVHGDFKDGIEESANGLTDNFEQVGTAAAATGASAVMTGSGVTGLLGGGGAIGAGTSATVAATGLTGMGLPAVAGGVGAFGAGGNSGGMIFDPTGQGGNMSPGAQKFRNEHPVASATGAALSGDSEAFVRAMGTLFEKYFGSEKRTNINKSAVTGTGSTQ